MSGADMHVHSWALSLVITFGLAVTALVYLRGWHCLRIAFPNLIAGWRLAAFMSGLVFVWAAVASPLARLDHQSLTIHMIKHLLLMTVAAPLLLAGAPAFPLVCGLPKLFIKRHSLCSVPARWLEPCSMNSVFCWIVGTAAVIGWHVPAAFQSGMHYQGIHIFEDLSFLLSGILFWSVIVQGPPSVTSSPRWSLALYLFFATLPCDILSAFFVFCNRLVYPFYLSAPRLFSLSPLEDQECAGALMWVWVTFAYLIPAVVITLRILSPSNVRTQKAMQTAAPTGDWSRNGTQAEVR
jgi:cytochrome c oxidase assembly factor CtaG